jgi:hypothetical protein
MDKDKEKRDDLAKDLDEGKIFPVPAYLDPASANKDDDLRRMENQRVKDWTQDFSRNVMPSEFTPSQDVSVRDVMMGAGGVLPDIYNPQIPMQQPGQGVLAPQAIPNMPPQQQNPFVPIAGADVTNPMNPPKSQIEAGIAAVEAELGPLTPAERNMYLQVYGGIR